MGKRLHDVRAILTMDANEAMDKAALAYLRLFKGRPLMRHAVQGLMIGASFVLIWRFAGLPIALIVLALPFAAAALVTVLIVGRWLLRRN
jgi:hypothetical protein